jgi:hypothetical protein
MFGEGLIIIRKLLFLKGSELMQWESGDQIEAMRGKNVIQYTGLSQTYLVGTTPYQPLNGKSLPIHMNPPHVWSMALGSTQQK